jgi:shikimate kinase
MIIFTGKIGRMNIYLVGYMGSGKSTVGKLLSAKIGFSHLDLDDFFEETYKISIMDFFKKYDEGTFRKLETGMLQKTLSLDNHIISTGGGTPCFNDNMEFINANGLSVYIQMQPESLHQRLKHARRPRPRTTYLDDDALMQRILDDMLVREKYYLQAHITVKGENIDVDALAEKISAELNSLGSAD